jgi:hypothetical protein
MNYRRSNVVLGARFELARVLPQQGLGLPRLPIPATPVWLLARESDPLYVGYEPTQIPYLPPAMVEKRGVEPLASCLQGRRSDRLSYNPMAPEV